MGRPQTQSCRSAEGMDRGFKNLPASPLPPISIPHIPGPQVEVVSLQNRLHFWGLSAMGGAVLEVEEGINAPLLLCPHPQKRRGPASRTATHPRSGPGKETQPWAAEPVAWEGLARRNRVTRLPGTQMSMSEPA